MHSSTPLLAATVVAAIAVLGGAQARAQGSVTVNPSMAQAGRYLLAAPDSSQLRFVPELLQPGQESGPIHLHMPTERELARRRAEAQRQAQAAKPAPEPQPAPQMASAPPAPAAAPAPTPAPAPPPEAPQRAAATPPAPATTTPPAASGGAGLTGPGGLFSGPALTLHPTGNTDNSDNSGGNAAAAPEKQSSAAPPTQVAKATPAPPSSLPGPTRRSVILFAADATKPMESALDQIKFLAGDLNAAMTRPASRIELRAYGGARGDKGSDARRLALKRALAVRQILIDDGVDAGRIDVRAMGGAESGPADRVDIYVRA